MKSCSVYITIFFAAAAILLLSGFLYLHSNRFHKEVPLNHERELKVTLDAGFGDVTIERGKSPLILDADIETEKGSDPGDYIEYDVRDRIGYLDINTSADVKVHTKKHTIKFEGFHSNSWDMRFTDAIPISFELGLGLGKGDFDMTGLNVKDLKLSAGASSVALRFDAPNVSTIEDLTIESGLSKFDGEGLCNANFNHLKFEGGVGSYTLDFSGELKKEVDVDIEVGLGSLTVRIPDKTGVKILYDKNWITHVDLDKDFTEEQDGQYFSSNYRSAHGKMNIRIDAGLGSVRIKRER
jgi:hypothetical protein